MPAQDRVRRHERRDLDKQSPTKPMSQDSETPSVAVVETQARPGELGLQNAILLTQKRDDVRLLAMEPATQSRDQQLEREHARSLCHRRRSTCGTLRGRHSLSRGVIVVVERDSDPTHPHGT